MHLHTTINKRNLKLISDNRIGGGGVLCVTWCMKPYFETTHLFPSLSPRCQVIKLPLIVVWMHAVLLKYNPCRNEIMTRFLNFNSMNDVPLGHAFQVTSSLVMAMISRDHLRQWSTVLVSIEDQSSSRGGEDHLNKLLSTLSCCIINQEA